MEAPGRAHPARVMCVGGGGGENTQVRSLLGTSYMLIF